MQYDYVSNIKMVNSYIDRKNNTKTVGPQVESFNGQNVI